MSINRAQVTYKIKLCDDERVLRRPSVLFTSRPQSKNNFITSIPQRSRSQSELARSSVISETEPLRPTSSYIIEKTPSREKTYYCIKIERSNQSGYVERLYSELRAFNFKLKETCAPKSTEVWPCFPPKRPFSVNHFHESFLKERTAAIEDYLTKILYLSSANSNAYFNEFFGIGKQWEPTPGSVRSKCSSFSLMNGSRTISERKISIADNIQEKSAKQTLIHNIQRGIRSAKFEDLKTFRIDGLEEEVSAKMIGSDKNNFTEYEPNIFKQFRDEIFDYKNDFLDSVSKLLELGISEGQSGQIFYISEDKKFILKTITREELHLLLRLLSKYADYVKSNPSTFIPKFTGLYSTRITEAGSITETHFITMNNVFKNCVRPDFKFDLKGSTHNRIIDVREVQDLSSLTLKDRNFSALNVQCSLNAKLKKQIVDQISKDCKWLESYNIMDYSLLIGVKNSKKEGELETQRLTRFSVNSGMIGSSGCYYFGIIDILQEFVAKKKMEAALKSFFPNPSCVNPQWYSDRFQSYMSDVVFK